MSRGVIRIGVSGWTFAPWRGLFYPPGLRRQHELHYAADAFSTLEVTDTFYGMQRAETFTAWRSQVPGYFVFSVRGPRLITHTLRLRNTETALAAFFASGLLSLGPHLGPILWQVPPNIAQHAERLEAFLGLLPEDTRQAADLVKNHYSGPQPLYPLAPDRTRSIRHALSISADIMKNSALFNILRARNIALVRSDGATPVPDTADFIYCRLTAATQPQAGDYADTALADWARRIRAWATGQGDGRQQGLAAPSPRRDVFVVFDNTNRVRAPANALELIRRVRG